MRLQTSLINSAKRKTAFPSSGKSQTALKLSKRDPGLQGGGMFCSLVEVSYKFSKLIMPIMKTLWINKPINSISFAFPVHSPV